MARKQLGAAPSNTPDATSKSYVDNAITNGVVSSAAKWTTARNLAGNSVDGSANVAFSNKFIVQGTADTGLSGAQFLGSLATGLVKNTTSTGVLSIATANTDYTVPLTTTAVKTGAYSAAANEFVPSDATSAGFTVTLPTSPVNGTRVAVKKMDSSVNLVTIVTGGLDYINASPTTSMTLSVQHQTVTFQYQFTSSIWYIVSSDAPLSQLDARYATTTGISLKQSVRVATTGSETFTISSGAVTQIAGTTIDGVSVASGDRILIKNAPAATGAGDPNGAAQPGNGIYVVGTVSSNIPVTRTTDMSGSNSPYGALVAILSGATLPGWIFQVSNPVSPGTFTYNSTSMAWGVAYSNNLVVINYINSGTATMTNKWIQARVVSPGVSATYTPDITTMDEYVIGTQNQNITNLSATGTAVEGQRLIIRIKSDATPRTISWDSAKYVPSGTAALLSTTVASKTHVVAFMYDAVLGKFVCMACDTNGY